MNKPKRYEQKKPFVLHLRVTHETKVLLDEVSEKTGLEVSNLSRMLLLTSLRRLKSDSVKFGWSNLEILIRTQ